MIFFPPGYFLFVCLEAIAEQMSKQFKSMPCSGPKSRAGHDRWLFIFTSHTLGRGVESGFHLSPSQQVICSHIHSSIIYSSIIQILTEQSKSSIKNQGESPAASGLVQARHLKDSGSTAQGG